MVVDLTHFIRVIIFTIIYARCRPAPHGAFTWYLSVTYFAAIACKPFYLVMCNLFLNMALQSLQYVEDCSYEQCVDVGGAVKTN